MKLIQFTEFNRNLGFALGYISGTLTAFAGDTFENLEDHLYLHELLNGTFYMGGNDGVGIYMLEDEDMIVMSPTEVETILEDIKLDTDNEIVGKILIQMTLYNAYTVYGNLAQFLSSNEVPYMTDGNKEQALTMCENFITKYLDELGLEIDLSETVTSEI